MLLQKFSTFSWNFWCWSNNLENY